MKAILFSYTLERTEWVAEKHVFRITNTFLAFVEDFHPPSLQCLYFQTVFLCRYPRTAPQSVEGQMGLGDHDNTHRAFSAPVVNKLTTAGSSSSSSSERSESSLSGLSSASDMRQGASPDGSINEAKGLNLLPTDRVNPLELLGGDKGHGQNSHTTYDQPRPPSEPRAGSQGSQRLGSAKHRVLPPISPVL